MSAECPQAINPADYFTLAMDEEIRQEGMPGSLCGFALELDQAPDIIHLQQRIKEFLTHFPIALSSLQQKGKRFYWCERAIQRSVFFHHDSPPNEDQDSFVQDTLQNILNTQETREEVSPIEFHLLTSEKNNIFLIRWLHPFCDARGADLILKYLCTDDEAQRQLFDQPFTEALVNAQLKKFTWWQKIDLFLKAKRHIEKLDCLQSIMPVDINPTKTESKKLNYSTQRLSLEDTEKVVKQIQTHVGLTGTSLYYLGCLMRALDKINPEHPGAAYCVPYAFNLRKNKAISPVLGNHVCALFAQAPRELVKDRKLLFQHLKQQNIDVIRNKLDYAFLPLMWAASWLPLNKYGKTLRLSYTSGTERSSFWFSDIGKPDLSGLTFFGSDIVDLIHLCQISSPPALALLSCHYRQRLSLTYNYIEPYINAEFMGQLQHLMLQELLGE